MAPKYARSWSGVKHTGCCDVGVVVGHPATRVSNNALDLLSLTLWVLTGKALCVSFDLEVAMSLSLESDHFTLCPALSQETIASLDLDRIYQRVY